MENNILKIGDCINGLNSLFLTLSITFTSEIPVLPAKGVDFIDLDLILGHVTCSNQQKKTEMLICPL